MSPPPTPRLLSVVALILSAACGGLYSDQRGAGGAGGGGARGGLGPPTCMRTLSDAIQVSSPPAPDAFLDIQALLFDPSHNLYVLIRSSPNTAFVDVLSPSRALLRSIGKGLLGPARGLALSPSGVLFVVEDYEGSPPTVKRFELNGNYLGTWTASGPGQDSGLSLAFDGSGLLNIGGIGHIFRYRADGSFMDSYGLYGMGAGRLLFPTGLSWEATGGFVWVADLFQNSIEKYSPGSDTQLLKFGGRGVGDGKFDANEPTGTVFYGPRALALDAEGKLVATDPWSSRIQKFAPNGAFLGQFNFGGSTEIGPVAIDPTNGVIYVGRGASIDLVCPL